MLYAGIVPSIFSEVDRVSPAFPDSLLAAVLPGVLRRLVSGVEGFVHRGTGTPGTGESFHPKLRRVLCGIGEVAVLGAGFFDRQVLTTQAPK